MKKHSVDILVLLITIIFIVSSLFILDDYGPIMDSPKNYYEGKVNLDYILTGIFKENEYSWEQMHGAFSFMLSELSKRIFCDKLNLLDQLSARHLILPLMSGLFLLPFYFFVKKYFGQIVGLASILVFITYPHYFGHTFNNLKDIPVTIFLSLSIMSFVSWYLENNLRYLYLFFICIGLAICIKIYALISPLILLIWVILIYLFRIKINRLQNSFNIKLHCFIGMLIIALMISLFFSPAFWGLHDKLHFLSSWFTRTREVATSTREYFNLYPFQQVLYRTPLPALILFLIGLVKLFLQPFKSKPLNLLLVVWFFFPLLLASTPHLYLYQSGMRLFFAFIVPFSILVGIGLESISELLGKVLNIKNIFALLMILLVVSANINAIRLTHPYEIVFFNSIFDGLNRKEQEYDYWDYWLFSYKEAGKWLDKNANPNSNIVISYYNAEFPLYRDVINYCISRNDLNIIKKNNLPDTDIFPENTYIIVRHPLDLSAYNFLRNSLAYEPVYMVKKQGRLIFSINYKK